MRKIKNLNKITPIDFDKSKPDFSRICKTNITFCKNVIKQAPNALFFDVVNYTHLTKKELKEHIDRVGKIIYLQQN